MMVGRVGVGGFVEASWLKDLAAATGPGLEGEDRGNQGKRWAVGREKKKKEE